MLKNLKRLRPSATTVVVAVGVAVLVGATSATAATLITGKDIKSHTITGKDVKHHSLTRNDFTRKAIKHLHGKRGKTGPRGHRGFKGARGAAGAAGKDATFSSLPWGLIGRNTIGSPVAQYRVGPGTPPLGVGSLGLEVAGPPNGDTNPADAQKISFGVDGTDFTTETGIADVQDIESLSYQAYTDLDITPGSTTPPGITIESDPDINDASNAPITYTSLVYVPPTATSEETWQSYDTTLAATSQSGWFATGKAGTATGCTLANLCSLGQLQSQLGANASIITFAIAKGRDNAFNGAVDDIEVGNGTTNSTFDFEPLGVTVSTS
jgi:hypothetical protein